ncbi:uncharacterized protein [Lolium perenne]|uniref:uncharacterized protein isoform X2 n=1 Tax=Lolium perenne TaxID=4522 RepID=UPI0021F53912|nr:L10-interacting MYB domain-containing protein-like isoform X2 [Lolium perenne]XP_051192803.1 L10-interacting MYB domain-containing protein-like isoform X2 [Lolium perenne]
MEKAIWNEHYTTVFCEICKDEVDANNRPLGCLNRRGYKNLGEKFFAQTGKKLTKKQFKNKWDLLKKEYTQFMELKNAATGLGWDYVRGTIEADEVWWKVHLEKYPKHAKYKKKGLANLDELDAMFDKAHVTGATSCIPGEISDSSDDEGLVEVLESEDGDDAKAKDVSPKADKDGKLKDEKEDGKKKSVKRKARYIDESAKEDKNPFLREYKVTLGNINEAVAATHAPTSAAPTMKEVLTLMKECGAQEGTPLYFTATDLVMQPSYRELFVLIETKEGRLDWLQRKHSQMNK